MPNTMGTESGIEIRRDRRENPNPRAGFRLLDRIGHHHQDLATARDHTNAPHYDVFMYRQHPEFADQMRTEIGLVKHGLPVCRTNLVAVAQQVQQHGQAVATRAFLVVSHCSVHILLSCLPVGQVYFGNLIQASPQARQRRPRQCDDRHRSSQTVVANSQSSGPGYLPPVTSSTIA